jgi:hypothetical protein
MWFLAAGVSAAAGIPAADDMVWNFKRSIYCSREKVPLSRCPDLSDNRLRSRLQRYFDDQGGIRSGRRPMSTVSISNAPTPTNKTVDGSLRMPCKGPLLLSATWR